MTPIQLEYTIENASIGTAQREAVINGETVTITSQRAEIEAIPADDRNGTLKLSLPPEVLADLPEGATLTVTVTTDPAA